MSAAVTPYLDARIKRLAGSVQRWPEDEIYRAWYDQARRNRALRRQGCPPRAAAVLSKHGYASRVEVQALDDDTLRDLHGMGLTTFASIRRWAPWQRRALAGSRHPWWLLP